MTNTTYFYDTIREYWSASTSPNETPRTSSVETDPFSSATQTTEGEGGKLENSNLKRFNFKQLQTATRNFHPDLLLGHGCVGPVFKAWVDENKLTASKPGQGTAVAVKWFSGHHGWSMQNEIKHLGHLHHPNLVRLSGFCSDNEQRLLVYELMPETSLDHHLYEGRPCLLSWRFRIKIALGVAKGLAFLHSEQINVIHRGVQCSSILLDLSYNAKLSGFSLAVDGPTGDMSHINTTVRANHAIIAPEYALTGCLTTKCDVYRFGIVLFEIISGQRIDSSLYRLPEEQSLQEGVWRFLLQNTCFDGEYSMREYQHQKAAHIVYDCLSIEANYRPNMAEVVKALEDLQNLDDLTNAPIE